MILYEYPFNERVRAYLRLEYLFDRLFFFSRGEDIRHHQIALTTLFDILDLIERTDVRTALLQDIERQRNQLSGLRDHPQVDQQTLEALLNELTPIAASLATSAKGTQMLRGNEWLISLRGRVSGPGGASQVDMPSYHSWQHKPIVARHEDLQIWSQPLMALHEGGKIVLRLLRESGERSEKVADDGSFQQMLGGKVYQLLRVWVPPEANAFPEISGNKYMIGMRFFNQIADGKPQHAGHSVSFLLALCGV